jgi:Lytic polysaccharide mono-oxygenase, cellulose-degrading
MPRLRLSSRVAVVSVIAGVCAAAVPRSAEAHFILQQPPASQSADSLGSPQKLGPCGGETATTPTNIVTTYQEGQTITIQVEQTVPHTGHWRVSLGMTGPSSLPAEPAVTASSTSPCGSAAIENPPVFPVLGDDLLDQPTPPATNAVATFQVTLPKGMTCNNCTMQVLEFMSNHPLNNPGGCYYHHCAQISIVAGDSGAASSSSSTMTVSSSSSAGGGSSSQASSGSSAHSSGSGSSTGGGRGGPGAASGSGSTSQDSSEATGGGGSTASSSVITTTEADGAVVVTMANPSDTNSGGCSIARGTSSAGMGFFGLVAFAALLRPRRRR